MIMIFDTGRLMRIDGRVSDIGENWEFDLPLDFTGSHRLTHITDEADTKNGDIMEVPSHPTLSSGDTLRLRNIVRYNSQ